MRGQLPEIVQDWVFPRHCLLCLGAARGLDLCPGCRGALPWIENPCRGCGVPLIAGARCGRCLKSPLPFHHVNIPYRYTGSVTALIHALKFRRQLVAAAVLGRLLVEYLQGIRLCRPQCIVPVPLHPTRQRERGFNQSLEIARPLSARLGIPIAPALARRIRPTAAQSGLGGADSRRANVRGAFVAEINPRAPLHHVAVIDDVVTTGATVTAVALALRNAGVTRIQLWSIARAADP